MNRERLYWAAPALLVVVAAAFAVRSTSELRYEEVAESVRNVWWLEQRTLYDKTSSNVGWYGLLLATYHLTGFHLHAAKVVRVLLTAGSLSVTAELLRRTLGTLRAIPPLLAFGLSPTLLVLGTSQASFGIDAAFVPMILALILFQTRVPGARASAAALPWLLAMLAWLCFPTVAFSLPTLALVHALRLHVIAPAPRMERLRYGASVAASAAAGFATPFLLALAFLREPAILLDGAFRGGGHLAPGGALFASNLRANLADLLDTGASYHFQLAHPEFGAILPVIALAVAVVIAARSAPRITLVLALLPLLLGVVLVDLSDGPPGARRITPWLLSLYALYALAWKDLPLVTRNQRIAAALLLLLPFHHLAVLAPNLAHASDPSPFRDPWFSSRATPSESLSPYVERARAGGIVLACANPADCRYAEIYAAIAGSCAWNALHCGTIAAIDPAHGTPIPLSTRLWETNYLEH